MPESTTSPIKKAVAWVTREDHRARARELGAELNRAFTQHPHDTDESYLEHLWFTAKMAGRLLFAMLVLIIHGVFPFLLVRTASHQIELIYAIIKARIPKSRRDFLDMDPGI